MEAVVTQTHTDNSCGEREKTLATSDVWSL